MGHVGDGWSLMGTGGLSKPRGQTPGLPGRHLAVSRAVCLMMFCTVCAVGFWTAAAAQQLPIILGMTGNQPPEMDIVMATIQRPAPGVWEFIMELKGPPPAAPEVYTEYKWMLDTDLNPAKTDDRDVRVSYDPDNGWQAYIGWNPEWQCQGPLPCTIDGNRITVRLYETTFWHAFDPDGDGIFAWNATAAVYVRGLYDCVPETPPMALVNLWPGTCNHPPVITSVTTPVDPVLVNDVVTAEVTFGDADLPRDIHGMVVDWGDGTEAEVLLRASSPVVATHTYVEPGIYAVSLAVTDGARASDRATSGYVVVYNPDGGFVTGGGWVNSPIGAYVANPALTGKATFGLISKYLKGKTVPTGETQFQFKVAGMDFHSTSYEWLFISGAKARYRGLGKINGAGDYGFLLIAIDGKVNGGGGQDKFRIKVWDNSQGHRVVYDNQLDAGEDVDPTTVLGGGSIVIHKEAQSGTAAVSGVSAQGTGLGAAVIFTLSAEASVGVEVLNIAGRTVRQVCADKLATAGVNTVLWDGRSQVGTRVPIGRYLVRVTVRGGDGGQSQALVPLMLQR
jgi:PKD repeat protein